MKKPMTTKRKALAGEIILTTQRSERIPYTNEYEYVSGKTFTAAEIAPDGVYVENLSGEKTLIKHEHYEVLTGEGFTEFRIWQIEKDQIELLKFIDLNVNYLEERVEKLENALRASNELLIESGESHVKFCQTIENQLNRIIDDLDSDSEFRSIKEIQEVQDHEHVLDRFEKLMREQNGEEGEDE